MNQLDHIVNNFKCVTPLVVFSISVRFYFIHWMSSVVFEKHPPPHDVGWCSEWAELESRQCMRFLLLWSVCCEEYDSVSKHLTGKPLDPHEGIFCCLYQESLSVLHCTAIVISQQKQYGFGGM